MLSLERSAGLDDTPDPLLDEAATWLLVMFLALFLAGLAAGLS